MATVYKYPVPLEGVFQLDLPKGARLLSFQAQRDEACLWALVDPEALSETRSFRLAGTGHPIDMPAARLAFVGTAQFRGGSLVFHLFEITAIEAPSPSPAP